MELSHRYGVARNYFSKGCVNFEVNWVQGKRFPKGVSEYFPIEVTEFEGINDYHKLSEAFENEIEYYKKINLLFF